MREIKFRQFIHGAGFHYWGVNIDGATFVGPPTINNVKPRGPHEQFTGMYDKTGKEIYEGDIIKAWDRGLCGVKEVRWRKEASPCYVLYPSESVGQWYLYAVNIGGVYKDDGVEVIGNIHENPELLEAKP